jgi:SanA protein
MKYLLKILWRSLAILVLFIGLIFFLIKLQTDPYTKTVEDLPSQVHTAVVLGASILPNGDLSLVLKDRADTAIQLYVEEKVTTILVTGDDGTLTHNEVRPIRKYLLANGIPDKAIFLDHAGFDTYSSMYRARDVFKVGSVVIVTQSFHLPRALFIARKLGIDVYGVSADKHQYMLKNNVREVFADVKAMLDILTNRKPKYLGDEIPVK